MTNFTTKMMIAAAAMVVAASAASAPSMKAAVPFAYHTGGKTLAAGTYQFSMNDRGVVSIDAKNGRHILFELAVSRIEGGDGSAAKLVFSCHGDDCTLLEAWTGTPGAAYKLASPKARDLEATLVVIPLHRNAD